MLEWKGRRRQDCQFVRAQAVKCVPVLILEIASSRHLRLDLDALGDLGSVWILLTRHVVNREIKSGYIALHVNIDASTELGDVLHIAPKVCRFVKFIDIVEQSTTNRSLIRVAHKSWWITVMTQLLWELTRVFQLRLDSLSSSLLSVTAAFDGDQENVGFTLTVYCTSATPKWRPMPTTAPYNTKVVQPHFLRYLCSLMQLFRSKVRSQVKQRAETAPFHHICSTHNIIFIFVQLRVPTIGRQNQLALSSHVRAGRMYR